MIICEFRDSLLIHLTFPDTGDILLHAVRRSSVFFTFWQLAPESNEGMFLRISSKAKIKNIKST